MRLLMLFAIPKTIFRVRNIGIQHLLHYKQRQSKCFSTQREHTLHAGIMEWWTVDEDL